ncbi:unnamed protein product [Rotaria sp. Silwood1]|nr:unnamed protein product [Rotaria sp. Silwood1]CAF1664969.1 unnamed protein product [Rotaria sp. Silwood1]
MTKRIMDQYNTESLSTINNTHETNTMKDHRIFSEEFLLKVSECIKIANNIRTDYGIDILETNGSFEITDKVINHLDSLLSIYYQNVNQNNNNIDSIRNLFEQNDDFKISNLYDNYSNSIMLSNKHNEIIKIEKFPSEDVHCIAIKLPTIVEMQLRNNQLLRNVIHNYRHHERYLNLSKKNKISSIKTRDKQEDVFVIEAKPLCPMESNDTLDSSSVILSKTKENVTKLMNHIHNQYKNKNHKKDIEDVLNGIVMLTDQSTSSFSDQINNKIANELMSATQKQGYTINRERIHVRMALDLILVDNRLNGKTMIFQSESIILSRMIRKIYLCTQVRTLCSYGDVITIINDPDYHQIRFRTYKRLSLSLDEFIEILDASDIIDLDTNLIHSSILTSKQIDDMIKYIVREDAIKQLLKLIFNRTRNSDSHIDDEYRQFKLNLPMKLNDLYQTIKKLNAFSKLNRE